ncbi:unnamed protein product [Candidula unifasciata]|uniref:Exonuclease 1 n=1 Tax=Candidula unifasciata TaxID=100452 RepID=A0A8S3ZPK9_9EUPU|nr:unnamed protein product [Candidula unifasciata]
MGIQGLLPFLKAIHTPVNIADFPGSTVAIDAYCWLHRGAFSCAEKLAVGEKTDQYVFYCMKYVEYMLRKNLKPILVFDGGHLKSKADVEKTRRERRELHRKKAAQFLREGKRSEAKECLQRCVDITPQMALELMNACRDRGVDCIVAPYEADAQLAYLNLRGIADIIVTEDSDLLLFGCEKIIFKMDLFGNGILIEKSRLNEVLSIKGGFYTFEKFRHMCILSGCDYLPSIPGIGLAKACKVMKSARQPDIRQMLRKLPTYLKTNLTVTDEYVEGFVRADNTFLYQLVFDPVSRQLCPLNPYPPEVEADNLGYAGENPFNHVFYKISLMTVRVDCVYLPEEKAYQIAVGNIDAHSHKCISYFDPDSFVPKNAIKPKFRHQLSIWDRNYCIKSGSPCKEIQPTKEERKVSLHGQVQTVTVRSFKQALAKRVRSGCLENSENVLRDEEMKDSDSYTQNHEADEVFSGVDDGDHLNQTSDSEEEKPRTSLKRKMSVSPWKPSAANIGEDAFRMTSSCAPGASDGPLGASDSAPSPGKSRNVFAIPGGAVKVPKFDLNTPAAAAVHVRSRYFVSNSTAGQAGEHKQTSPVLKKLRQSSPRASTSQKLKKTSPKASVSSTSQKDSLVKGQKSIQAMFENVPVKIQSDASQEHKPKPVSKNGILRFVSPVNSQLPPAKDSFRNLKQMDAETDCTHETAHPMTSNKGLIQETDQSLAGLKKFQSRFSPSCNKDDSPKRSSSSAFNWSKYQTGLGSLKLSVTAPHVGQAEFTESGQQIKVEKDSENNEIDHERNTESEVTSHSLPDFGKATQNFQGTFGDQEICRLTADTPADGALITHRSGLHKNATDDLLNSLDRDVQNTKSKKVCSDAGVQLDVLDSSLRDKMADVSDDVVELKSCSYSDFLSMLDRNSQPGTSDSAAEVDSDNLANGIFSARESCGDSDMKSSYDQDDVIDLTDTESESQNSCLSVLSTSSASSVSGQAKCRVSGLSRHKGKSSGKNTTSSIPGQRSIKDLMSRFQYKS